MSQSSEIICDEVCKCILINDQRFFLPMFPGVVGWGVPPINVKTSHCRIFPLNLTYAKNMFRYSFHVKHEFVKNFSIIDMLEFFELC